MSEEYFMRQCLLRYSAYETVEWLPEKFCSLGKLLKLKEGESWTGPWKIEKVYPRRKSIKEVDERSRDHLKQRKFSDI